MQDATNLTLSNTRLNNPHAARCERRARGRPSPPRPRGPSDSQRSGKTKITEFAALFTWARGVRSAPSLEAG